MTDTPTVMQQDMDTGKFEKATEEHIVMEYLSRRGDWRARLAKWVLGV